MIPLDVLAKTLLLPFLLAEGGWARLRAGRLPEPPGPRSGIGGAGPGLPGLSLLVVGDSSAAGVGAAHQDQALMGRLVAGLTPHCRLRWRLEARTGATTADSLARLERATPEHFDLALVVLGVNDITRGQRLTLLLERRARLYRLLRRKFRAGRILVAGLPPVGDFPVLPQPLRWVLGRQAARFDATLQRQAGALGVEYLPFDIPFRRDLMASDGFHPGPEAYRLWARTLLEGIGRGADPGQPARPRIDSERPPREAADGS